VVGRVRRLVQNDGVHSLTRAIGEIKSAARKGREERSLAALAEKAAPGIAGRTERQETLLPGWDGFRGRNSDQAGKVDKPVKNLLT
jgi:hypothetical protein